MTTSMKKHQLYGEYINPTIDQFSTSQKENPLVLMAQACNNIGKELPSTMLTSTNGKRVLSSSSSSSPPLFPIKSRKSNSPPDARKSLKRSSAPSSSPPPAKKMMLPPPPPPPPSAPSNSNTQHSFYLPPSPFMFDSLLLHHLSKTFSSAPCVDFTLPSFLSTTSFGHSSNSAFSPSSPYQPRSPYFMDSILAPLKPATVVTPPQFVCNWMESNHPDGFCGKRFANQMSLLEHLCTAHTQTSIKSSYTPATFSSYYPATSVGKF